MKLSDFKVGTEFVHRQKTFRCTDVGSRVVIAICLSEVTQTQTRNVGGKVVKEQVAVLNPDASWFEGPPYGIPERAFNERELPECRDPGDCPHCGAPHAAHAH
jgi:hypothetical protein